MAADDDDTMTWHDREVVTALRRLASARSRLDQLLADQPEPPTGPTVSRADLDELAALRDEIEALGAKARARFGGGGARERRAELQARERLVLQRLGVASYAEAVAASESSASPGVDPEVLDFARRELQAAEAAWREIQALEVPEAEPEDPPADAEAIDLRLDPPAAS